MNDLQRVKKEILAGTNLSLYIGIGLSLVVAAGSIFGLNVKYVIPSALLVMGLILENLLRERWNREAFLANLFPPTSWGDCEKEFRERLASACKVSFLAVSPYYLLKDYENELLDILSNEHGQVRFLVVDPTEKAMDLIEVGRPENKNDGVLFQQCMSALFPATPVSVPSGSVPAQQLQPIAHTSPTKFTCKQYNYIPSCIITLIDDEEADGIIFVTIYSYKQGDPARPAMKLTRADGAWYTFFQKEFADLWDIEP